MTDSRQDGSSIRPATAQDRIVDVPQDWGGSVQEDRLSIPYEQVAVRLTKEGVQLVALQQGGPSSGLVAACGSEVGVLAVGALIAYHDRVASYVEMTLGSVVILLLFRMARPPHSNRRRKRV